MPWPADQVRTVRRAAGLRIAATIRNRAAS
jgi:hypothetical protein